MQSGLLAQNTGLYLTYLFAMFAVNATFYTWVRRLYGRGNTSPAFSILFGVLMAGVMGLVTDHIDNEPLLYLIVLCATFLLLLVLMRPSADLAGMGGIFMAFQTTAMKGAVIGVMSLILNRNMYQVLQVRAYAQLATVLSAILMLVTILIYSNAFDQESFAALRTTPSQKQFVLMAHSILLVFMLFNSYNYYYNMEMVWFSVAQILTAAIMEAAYAVIMLQALQVSRLLKIELKNQEHVRQMDSQVTHYRYMRKMEEDDLAMRKEAVQLAAEARRSLASGSAQQAEAVLSRQQNMMEQNIRPYAPYSNVEAMDAMLYATANDAIGKGIRFEADVEIPEGLSMSVRDLHQILSILIRFSMQNIARMDAGSPDRFLAITSSNAPGWMSLRVSCSYAGKLKVTNGGDINHPALIEVSNLVKAAEGNCDVSTDQARHVFTCGIRLHSGVKNHKK